MNDTDLILEGEDQKSFFPPFSARECTQSLTPIPQGEWRRTFNGMLVNVGGEGHRKFHTLIQCKDKVAPAFGRLWSGSCLRVGCIQMLTQVVPAAFRILQTERPVLSFSVFDVAGKPWNSQQSEAQRIEISEGFPGGFLTYRPWLIMRVLTYHLETDEWGLTVGWRLEMEEE